MSLEVDAAVAAAALIVLLPNKDSDDLSKIVNMVVNSLSDAHAAAYIGCSQDVLLEWHAGKAKGGADALVAFKTKMKAQGIEVPA